MDRCPVGAVSGSQQIWFGGDNGGLRTGSGEFGRVRNLRVWHFREVSAAVGGAEKVGLHAGAADGPERRGCRRQLTAEARRARAGMGAEGSPGVVGAVNQVV